MNEQELQELHKKLAEWAGFTWRWETQIVDVEGKKKRVRIYLFPDGSRNCWSYTNGLPNFPQSLDACFKWLVPKLRDKYDFQLVCFQGMSNFSAELHEEGTANWINIRDNNPALALCLAIEKLIDSKE